MGTMSLELWDEMKFFFFVILRERVCISGLGKREKERKS